MTDFDPTITERAVILTVDVSTDQELADVHAALSRTAVGYICDGQDSHVYVVTDEEDEDGVVYIGVRPAFEAGE